LSVMEVPLGSYIKKFSSCISSVETNSSSGLEKM